MKAYVAENWCEPEELVYKDVEDPTPKEKFYSLSILFQEGKPNIISLKRLINIWIRANLTLNVSLQNVMGMVHFWQLKELKMV